MTRIQQAEREFNLYRKKLQIFFDGGNTIGSLESFEHHARHWFAWGVECRKAGLFDEVQEDETENMDLIELLHE